LSLMNHESKYIASWRKFWSTPWTKTLSKTQAWRKPGHDTLRQKTASVR
jgi:hypothetical protein